MDRVAIKLKAKEFAYKNKWNIWAPLLLMMGIAYGVSTVLGLIEVYTISFEIKSLYYLIEVVELFIGFAMIPLGVGFTSYMIKLIRTGVAPDINVLFHYYRKDCVWKIILVTIVAYLIIFALSLLLVIPGIIYAFKYAMISYVLAEQFDDIVTEEPEAAYKVSDRLMDGHKMDYFVFQLSFIGWFILCALTLGILYIWIYPYYIVANTMWYEELKKISK